PAAMSRRVTSVVELAREQAVMRLVEARDAVRRARRQVVSTFPDWKVRSTVLEGDPSEELLRRAEAWRPRLIVVGSQGRSALGRFLLGSVSKTVAGRARCSVRVARRGAEKEEGSPPRVIIGADGSAGATRAVRAVWSREWPEGTEVRVVAVDDGGGPVRLADVTPNLEEFGTACNEGPPVNARLMAEGARVVLLAKGLGASVVVREGDPRRVLVEEAEAWSADSVFVGSHGLGRPLDRSGLGGVAAALVTGAPCSVEVVR
ncbi:MAG TPA: universal stress protein, partial [Pyrinomonadaceae bacterium]|nr:universal stress protein [Pyrinomonadaceae bacterium]